MKKHFFILLLGLFFSLSFTNNAFAQSAEIQREIDQQIWKVFTEAYNSLDADKFNSIHSNKVLRANAGQLLKGEEYKKANANGFLKGKEAGIKQSIAFSFEQRQATAAIAYEVGYYKVKVVQAGVEKTYYGYFHVVLEKTEGKWKIVQDWDSGEVNGKKIGEEDFVRAALLKF